MSGGTKSDTLYIQDNRKYPEREDQIQMGLVYALISKYNLFQSQMNLILEFHTLCSLFCEDGRVRALAFPYNDIKLGVKLHNIANKLSYITTI